MTYENCTTTPVGAQTETATRTSRTCGEEHTDCQWHSEPASDAGERKGSPPCPEQDGATISKDEPAMSLLADTDIRRELAYPDGLFQVDPFEPANLQPASLDVRLAPGFISLLPVTSVLDLDRSEDGFCEMFYSSCETQWVLHPGEFVLGSTVEQIKLGPAMAARLEGRSSLGRVGLLVHSTAGWVDPGFRGTLTLEIFNASPRPVRLRAGMRIGQLCFFRLESPASRPYGSPGLGSKYQGQSGVTPRRTREGTDEGVSRVPVQPPC